MLDDLFLISSTTLVLSCLFTAITLWISTKDSKAKQVMAISFTILTLFAVVFFIQSYVNSCEKIEKLDFIYSIFCIWLVYTIYLYFKVLMRPQGKNKRIIRNLIISLSFYIGLYILFSFIFAPVYLFSLKDIVINANNPMVWLRIVVFVHYLVLFVFATISVLKMYHEHKKIIASQFSYKEQISLSWLPYILFLFIFDGIATVFDIFLSGYNPMLYIVSNFAYSVFYMLCGFLVVYQEDIIYNDIQDEYEEIHKDNNEIRLQNIPPNTRVQLKKSLKILMEEKKIYLNPELRLDTVTKMLQTNRTYLSLLIKEDFGDNFIGFVNHYRIEEAKKLMADIENKSSLYEIAEQVGFKSLSSFNLFFKRFANQAPAGFRKSCFEQTQTMDTQ